MIFIFGMKRPSRRQQNAGIARLVNGDRTGIQNGAVPYQDPICAAIRKCMHVVIYL